MDGETNGWRCQRVEQLKVGAMNGWSSEWMEQ
jgi:hypothetical protein